MQDNLRPTTIVSDGPFDAKRTVTWNRSAFCFVTLPNDGGKRLNGVGLVEVDVSQDRTAALNKTSLVR
jgi:hypothetical protein